jgi:hypothetical protein
MDPFQSHCFSENLVAQGIELESSENIARNSDYWTAEAVISFFAFITENISSSTTLQDLNFSQR